MEAFQEEAGVSFRRKLVRSWLKWVGHVERLMKRVDALTVESRRRGRPQ